MNSFLDGVTVVTLKETVANPIVDRRTRGGETAIEEFKAGTQIAIIQTQMKIAGVSVPTVSMLTEGGVRIKSDELLKKLGEAETAVSEPGAPIAIALTGLAPNLVLDDLIAAGMVTPAMILDACAAQNAKRAEAEAAAAAAAQAADEPATADVPGGDDATAVETTDEDEVIEGDDDAPVDPMAVSADPLAPRPVLFGDDDGDAKAVA